MRPIYLSYLTAPVDDPFEALRIAANAGYAVLGLRLCDPATGMGPLRWSEIRRCADGSQPV